MADVLEGEALKNFNEEEEKNPMLFNSIVDFSTILSGINISGLKHLLEMLDKAYKPMSNEQIVISLALQALPNGSKKHKFEEEFIQCILRIVLVRQKPC